MALPDFVDDVLPPGDYLLTIDELRHSMLVTGRAGVTDDNWDSRWRGVLVKNLGVLVQQLWDVGIEKIYIDGSFVENKAHPGDIDGYFECPWKKRITGELEQSLNAIDPYMIWTWRGDDRQEYAGKPRLPMWIRYRVELYPHLTGCPISLTSGILDERGNELEFPSAFRQSRSFIPKGIVQIART